MDKRTRTKLAVLALLAIVSVETHAGPPGTWTKISTGSFSAGRSAILRTPEGKAHVVWPTTASGKHGLGHTGITAAGAVSGAKAVVKGWEGIHQEPRLLPDGTGLRLVFSGLRGSSSSDPYSSGCAYTATSKTGNAWTLGTGSFSKSGMAYASVGTGATLDLTGTPVVAWSFGIGDQIYWHYGLDTSLPAAADDKAIKLKACCNQNSNLATDAVSGTVWLAWWSSASGSANGYYARALLPSVGPLKKAPKSAASGSSVDPWQSVALSARKGVEGVYMAYSNPGLTRINLWKMGTTKVLAVPNSAGARYIVLTPGADGRLWLLWWAADQLHAVLTDEDMTTFGVEQTVAMPANTASVYHVAGEGSNGRLDIVVNVLAWSGERTFWHTQVVAN